MMLKSGEMVKNDANETYIEIPNRGPNSNDLSFLRTQPNWPTSVRNKLTQIRHKKKKKNMSF